MHLTTAPQAPDLTRLPWSLPLAQWPADVLAALPRGISRHVVRFAQVEDGFVAVKETGAQAAETEFALLTELRRRRLPCVRPLAVVQCRRTEAGDPLPAALVTRQLQFSLPYRVLFSAQIQQDILLRAIDAMAVLLVRLHLAGVYWGDVSLSNVLFRRDASDFAAYLVDAETAVLWDRLTAGQREQDLDIARTNITGDIFDLAAAHRLGTGADPVRASAVIVERYRELWDVVTAPESFGPGEMWRVQARIGRLNDLGFDVDEVDIATTQDGTAVTIRPKVVDTDHHAKRLQRLTGLAALDNQARRLLNDLDQFSGYTRRPDESEEDVAGRWVREVYLPVLSRIPGDLQLKLTSPQVFHEVLEHRWYLSEQSNRDVPMTEVLESYVRDVLRHKPDEATVLDIESAPAEPTVPDRPVADGPAGDPAVRE